MVSASQQSGKESLARGEHSRAGRRRVPGAGAGPPTSDVRERPVRVLHVITGLGTGGAETQLQLLLRHSRYEADVVTLHNPGAVAGQLRDDGVRVVDVGMRGNRDLRALAVLFRLIRSRGYDVVHTHLY